MKHKLTCIAVACAMIMTMFAGSQVAAADTTDTTADTQEVVIKNNWDASKTYYYDKKGNKVKGLKKIKGSYYYFNDKTGRVLKNKFKKVKQGKKRYVFYFGKKGAAYKAPANAYSVACKAYKIGKRYYGFDQYSHRVTGVWVAANGKAWYFKKNGASNTKKTKQLRKLTREGKRDSKQITRIRKLIGKPKRTIVNKNSCFHFDNMSGATYWDYVMRYPKADIQLTRNNSTGVYYVNGIFGRDK